ncbi:MAG: hypothetical protein M1438_05280 [Deltaproteobacteria bacterium]|nr:hypothetical protein [Deltaproteobacteria bacterium]
MSLAEEGMYYLRSIPKIALGAGIILIGAYLFSRVKERQDLEARLDRLQEMIEKLAAAEPKEATGTEA